MGFGIRAGLTLSILTLAGCVEPSPSFDMAGAKRTEVERDGRRFVVLQTDRAIEVYRMGSAPPSAFRALQETLVQIAEETAACPLSRGGMKLDPVMLRATLACR